MMRNETVFYTTVVLTDWSNKIKDGGEEEDVSMVGVVEEDVAMLTPSVATPLFSWQRFSKYRCARRRRYSPTQGRIPILRGLRQTRGARPPPHSPIYHYDHIPLIHFTMAGMAMLWWTILMLFLLFPFALTTAPSSYLIYNFLSSVTFISSCL